MKQKYDLSEMHDYFECWETPQSTAAKINAVAVRLADWFTELDDPNTNVFYLKESLDFLINLRMSIEKVKPIDA